MAKRPQQKVERRYVVEWVVRNYPQALTMIYNVRLGEVPAETRAAAPGQPESFFKVYLSYADAIVVTDSEIIVIEGKISEPEKGIGQLKTNCGVLYWLVFFTAKDTEGNYVFFFSFFNLRFSFGLSRPFFCCSLLPLSFFPLSPISVSPFLDQVITMIIHFYPPP